MKKKIFRTLFSLLPVDSNRAGECTNCGECCKLPIPCVFLKYDDEGNSRCAIYKIRPLNCRKYPRVEKEHITRDVCGYYFK